MFYFFIADLTHSQHCLLLGEFHRLAIARLNPRLSIHAFFKTLTGSTTDRQLAFLRFQLKLLRYFYHSREYSSSPDVADSSAIPAAGDGKDKEHDGGVGEAEGGEVAQASPRFVSYDDECLVHYVSSRIFNWSLVMQACSSKSLLIHLFKSIKTDKNLQIFVVDVLGMSFFYV
jgi:hypothetical protein